MIANWIHILIVHFAVIITPWLLYRVIVQRKKALDEKAWKNNYSLLIISGIIAGIAYFTGPEAADYLKEFLEPYSQEQVEDHALMGRIASVIQGIVALLGIMGWASILQEEMPDKRIPSILIFLLGINTLLMIYSAHLGGLIRRLDFL